MPELPEVETIARGLARRVTGDVIESVWLGSKPEPLKSSAAEIAATLRTRRIAGVRRVGKHIVFDLETAVGRAMPLAETAEEQSWRRSPHQSEPRAQWIVHLGMSGRMLVCDPGTEIAKHTHAIAKLASGRELRFVDPRRFGRLSVARGFEAAGSEPLDVDSRSFADFVPWPQNADQERPAESEAVAAAWATSTRMNRCSGRAFVPGGGLHRLLRRGSATAPCSPSEVLKEAIALGGSSVSDYVDADGEEGFFQLRHRVYGREGEPCMVCKTPIKRIVIAGRSSHYCPKCQR